MFRLLFSPDGRIFPEEFRKGAIVLLAINFFLWPSWYLGAGVGFLAFMITLVTIYCWTCLFAKRFHDAGKSGGWFALLFFIFAILSGILCFFIAAMRLGIKAAGDPELLEKVEYMQTLRGSEIGPEETETVLEIYKAMGELSIVPAAIICLIVGGGIAFITNAVLKSDPEPNRWG